MSLTAEIERRIQAFVGELNLLVRRQAMESVAAALGAPSPTNGRSSTRRGRPPKRAAVVATEAARLPRLRNGQKRDPKDLAKLVAAVGAHVKAHPGEGAEHIAKHLGVKPKEITLPIKKLLAAKEISSKGVKRATRYFPA